MEVSSVGLLWAVISGGWTPTVLSAIGGLTTIFANTWHCERPQSGTTGTVRLQVDYAAASLVHCWGLPLPVFMVSALQTGSFTVLHFLLMLFVWSSLEGRSVDCTVYTQVFIVVVCPTRLPSALGCFYLNLCIKEITPSFVHFFLW